MSTPPFSITGGTVSFYASAVSYNLPSFTFDPNYQENERLKQELWEAVCDEAHKHQPILSMIELAKIVNMIKKQAVNEIKEYYKPKLESIKLPDVYVEQEFEFTTREE